jgi:hypothetical protein
MVIKKVPSDAILSVGSRRPSPILSTKRVPYTPTKTSAARRLTVRLFSLLCSLVDRPHRSKRRILAPSQPVGGFYL